MFISPDPFLNFGAGGPLDYPLVGTKITIILRFPGSKPPPRTKCSELRRKFLKNWFFEKLMFSGVSKKPDDQFFEENSNLAKLESFGLITTPYIPPYTPPMTTFLKIFGQKCCKKTGILVFWADYESGKVIDIFFCPLPTPTQLPRYSSNK